MDLIELTRREGLAFDIRLRGHRLVTDMSVAEGGSDAGLSPIELLAASFGACLAIMTQRFCDGQGLTGAVGVSVTQELAEHPKRVAALVADVELPAGTPPRVREALDRVVKKFPIPATLAEAPRMDVEFAET